MNRLRNRFLPAEERFFAQLRFDASACWLWGGGISGSYGCLQVDGRRVKAHVFSYRYFVGDVGESLVLHTCDVPLCVNPTHLFLGTQADNLKDMVAKGRASQGEGRPASKLTEDDVRFIRANYRRGHPQHGVNAIARRLGVNYYTVMAVINGSAWKHVK